MEKEQLWRMGKGARLNAEISPPKNFRDIMNKIKKDICAICKREKSGKQVYLNHHISYDKDITFRSCRPCHNWLHGRQVYGHPFKTEYGKDEAPYVFANAVVMAYEKAWMDNIENTTGGGYEEKDSENRMGRCGGRWKNMGKRG